MKKLSIILCVLLMFVTIGCGNNNESRSTSDNTNQVQQDNKKGQTQKEQPQKELNWNTKDNDAEKNGNIKVASQLIRKNHDLASQAIEGDASEIVKRPWDYYGKVIQFTGTSTSAMRDFPESSNMGQALGGEACQIVIMSNSTPVEAFLLGSTQGIHQGDQVTFYAYPVGVSQVANKLGGKSIHLMVVGVK